MVGGSGLRPRLPGKSRLKTAPTFINSTINLGSFFCDLTGRFFAGAWAESWTFEPLNPEPLNPGPLNPEPICNYLLINPKNSSIEPQFAICWM